MALVVFLFLALYKYIALLEIHGTFFCLLTHPVTGYYDGGTRNFLSADTSLQNFRDPSRVYTYNPLAVFAPRLFRVVVTMTTMPDDITGLGETLQSLLNQTFKPDAIYVNVPYKSRRSGQLYVIPDFLSKMDDSIIVLRGEDYGPLSKIVQTLSVETEPSTLIVSVDTDKKYTRGFLHKLVHHAKLDNNVAWGICGWAFFPWRQPYGILPAYPSYFTRGTYGRAVQILQV